MGNISQKILINKYPNIETVTWPESMDIIVSNYLFDMSTKELRKFIHEKKCNKWIQTMHKLITDNSSGTDIDFLIDHIKVNNLNDVCKYYIKIAHIYSSIFFSLNPNFSGDNTFSVIKFNICKSNVVKKISNKEGEYIGGSNNKNIVPNLLDLYYDDFDFETRSFSTMSKSNKTKYNNELKLFYQVISNNELPNNIKHFHEITKKDFQKEGGGTINMKVFDDISSHLIIEYASTLKKLINETNNIHNSIINILSKLFVFIDDKETILSVHPKIKNLQEVIVDTRKLIIRMYLNCEFNYTKSIKIYESIVEQQILDTTKKQIKKLKNIRDELL